VQHAQTVNIGWMAGRSSETYIRIFQKNSSDAHQAVPMGVTLLHCPDFPPE
jgi:hypothetical protein